MRRVLDLDPFPATSRAVAAVAALGDDSLQPELAGVAEQYATSQQAQERWVD